MAPLADGPQISRFRVAVHVVIILSRWRSAERRRKSSNSNARLGRRLEGQVSNKEEKMIGAVLTSRGLLSKSTEAMELVLDAVDSEESVDLVLCWLHRMKYFACRSLWSTVVEPLQRDLDRQKESLQEMKNRFADARVSYLKEISLQRERGRNRIDPDVMLQDHGGSSFWTPEDMMAPEELEFFQSALKEKLKMIFDVNPHVSQTVDAAQLEALNRGVASGEREMFTKQLQERQQEILNLKKQLEQENAAARQQSAKPPRRRSTGASMQFEGPGADRDNDSSVFMELEAERSQSSKLKEQVDALSRSEDQLQQQLQAKGKQVDALYGKLKRNKTQNERMFAEIDELNIKHQEEAARLRRELEERRMQLDMREREAERLQAVASELRTQAEIRKQWLVTQRRNKRTHENTNLADAAPPPSKNRGNSDAPPSKNRDDSPPPKNRDHSHAELPARSMTAAVKLYISFNFMRYFKSQPISVGSETAAVSSFDREEASDRRPSGELSDHVQNTDPEADGGAAISSSQIDILLERCVRLEEQLQLESERRTHWENQCQILEARLPESRPGTSHRANDVQLSRRARVEEEITLLQQQRSTLAKQCELLKIAGEAGVASYSELHTAVMDAKNKENEELSARCTRLGDQLQHEEASRVHWERECKRLETSLKSSVETQEEQSQIAEDARAQWEKERKQLEAVLRLETSKMTEPVTARVNADDSREECSRLRNQLEREIEARAEWERKCRELEAAKAAARDQPTRAQNSGPQLDSAPETAGFSNASETATQNNGSQLDSAPKAAGLSNPPETAGQEPAQNNGSGLDAVQHSEFSNAPETAGQEHTRDLMEQCSRLKDQLLLERKDKEGWQQKCLELEASLHSRSLGVLDTVQSTHAHSLFEPSGRLAGQPQDETSGAQQTMLRSTTHGSDEAQNIVTFSIPQLVDKTCASMRDGVEASFWKPEESDRAKDPPPLLERPGHRDFQGQTDFPERTKVDGLSEVNAEGYVQEEVKSCAVRDGVHVQEAPLPLAPGLCECSVAGHSCSYKTELEAARLLIAEISSQLEAMKSDVEAVPHAKVQQGSKALLSDSISERHTAQLPHHFTVHAPPPPSQPHRPRPRPPQTSRKASKDSSRAINEPPGPPPFSAPEPDGHSEPSPSKSFSTFSNFGENQLPPLSLQMPPVNQQGSEQELYPIRKTSKCSTRSQMRVLLPSIELEEGGVAFLPASTTSRSGSKVSPRSPTETPARRVSDASAASAPPTAREELPLAVVTPQSRKLVT